MMRRMDLPSSKQRSCCDNQRRLSRGRWRPTRRRRGGCSVTRRLRRSTNQNAQRDTSVGDDRFLGLNTLPGGAEPRAQHGCVRGGIVMGMVRSVRDGLGIDQAGDQHEAGRQCPHQDCAGEQEHGGRVSWCEQPRPGSQTRNEYGSRPGRYGPQSAARP